MSNCTYYIGDTRDVLATIPDDSVDMVMTSPPFLALRSYLPADHPDKHREIGSEPTPAEFLDTLLALTADWERVLAPHGSIVVELGDTYAGSNGEGSDTRGKGHRPKSARGGATGLVNHKGPGWPLAKSLCGIPHLYHLSLAYGRNLLTGEPSPAGQWRVRNVVAWCRPNPPVGALGDKFRPATSYLTIATKSATRYFDLDAVRTDAKVKMGREVEGNNTKGSDDQSFRFSKRVDSNPAGAPPLDWWEIPTAPYKGSHYAVYPPALLERPIKSMCPQQVCTKCGEPRRRITGEPVYVADDGSHREGDRRGSWLADDVRAAGSNSSQGTGERGHITRVAETLGFTDCGHDSYRNGIVLDPFGGSGTTGAVATGLGRDAILIDIDERNADLARDRIGMFLTVEDARVEALR